MNTPPIVVDQTGVVQPRATSVLAEIGRTGHRVDQLVLAWLGQATESADTRVAYRGDIRQYLGWCEQRGLNPLEVKFPEASMWLAALAEMPNPKSRNGKRYARSTRLRKIAAVTSFYKYLRIAEAIDYNNPFRDQQRPKVEKGGNRMKPVPADAAGAMLDYARDIGFRTLGTQCAELVLSLLADLGVRVSEVVNIDLGDVSGDRRRIRFHLKGGKIRTKPVPDETLELLLAYLDVRPRPAEGHESALLLRLDGRQIDRRQVYRLTTKMAARAGLDGVSPHSLRHGWSDTAHQEGIGLEDRQAGLAHSSPDTTLIYTHRGPAPEDDPAHVVARRVHAARRKGDD